MHHFYKGSGEMGGYSGLNNNDFSLSHDGNGMPANGIGSMAINNVNNNENSLMMPGTQNQ